MMSSKETLKSSIFSGHQRIVNILSIYWTVWYCVRYLLLERKEKMRWIFWINCSCQRWMLLESRLLRQMNRNWCIINCIKFTVKHVESYWTSFKLLKIKDFMSTLRNYSVSTWSLLKNITAKFNTEQHSLNTPITCMTTNSSKRQKPSMTSA